MIPLIERQSDAALFLRPGLALTGRRFVRDACRLADTLPARPHVAVLCQDRYRCAVAIAAALLRGQVSLLAGDPGPPLLARLATDFPDAYALVDDGRRAPMPVHPMDAVGTEPEGDGALNDAGMPAIAADQPAIVVLTSGTTGRPVGTAKTWGELVARTRAASHRFGLTEAPTASVIGTVPPGHMYGLETTVLLPLHANVAAWCAPVFFPADIEAALAAVPAPRWLVTTPTHLRTLARAAPPRAAVARVVSATAPLEPALAATVERDWSTIVEEILGASEVGSIASRRTVLDEHWTMYPGLRFERGTSAALLVAAPHAEARPFGDRLERLDDPATACARFRLLGRPEDVVKRGGRRASLEGLAALLRDVAGVEDAVFFVADDARETGRLAALAIAPTRTADELLAALRSLVDPVFLPRPLRLVEALPRDALGKLPRAALLAALDRGSP